MGVVLGKDGENGKEGEDGADVMNGQDGINGVDGADGSLVITSTKAVFLPQVQKDSEAQLALCAISKRRLNKVVGAPDHVARQHRIIRPQALV